MNQNKHSDTLSGVLDTQPIFDWVSGDNGADRVERLLSDVSMRNIELYISEVNMTEVQYNVAAIRSMEYALEIVGYLQEVGVELVSTERTWKRAAEFKHEYTPNFPLADAYALASADSRDLPLLAGEDSDWEEPLEDGFDIEVVS